ncbi:MAG: dihydroorotate dehydrogenase [Clostridiaceae bacterium BRH_c20a]|nr:MAG: dihydroorotate dehydrogenase [Clostridiaceae bacterium BRH_c20a]
MINLSVEIAGIKFKNPVMVASGCYGFGREFSNFYDLNLLGAIMVKGLTLEPRIGNPPPRIAETPAGMLNSVGLQNPGVEGFIKNELPWLKQYDVPVIANINGHSYEEFAEITDRLAGVSGISALEVNISCPNVKNGGMFFGTDPVMAGEVVKRVRAKTDLPLIVKLSPNVTDIAEIAKAVEAAGADAVSLINTVLAMAIDIKTRRPALSNVVGGLSGPAVKPLAVRMVWQVAQAVSVPIIGMGGIAKAEDAIEFFLAGANAVAIGAANLSNPMVAVEVIDGLKMWLEQEKIEDIQHLVGGVII